MEKARSDYEKSLFGDLTSYAGMVGAGFSSTVDRLAQIIRDSHHPSLGVYKERLLMKTIANFLPSRYGVGTGFVIFPKKREISQIDPDNIDLWNLHDHDVSKQLDIIVYDCYNYPLVFRDGDFVVVRPEAVRSIIEVKGTLNQLFIKESLDLFIDFAEKWAQCDGYYTERTQLQLKTPSIFLMGFKEYVNPSGKKMCNGAQIRKQIADRYRGYPLNGYSTDNFPLLRTAYIYNECEVILGGWNNDEVYKLGYVSDGGKFIRYNESGKAELDNDKTIFSLLCGIHLSLESPYNGIISNLNQTMRTDVLPYKYFGFTEILRDEGARCFSR